MNCADVRARLPALLYGDLAADEASCVREHLAGCPSCQREQTAVTQVRHLLQAVPAPPVAVDLPRLYHEAARLQERRLRRWRRVAVASLAAAAAVVLAVLLSRMEIRLDANQAVLRWGAVPAPEQPAPLPPPEEHVIAAAPTEATAEVEQQLRLLTELVQALSSDADRRDESRQRELTLLRSQLQTLRQQMTQLRLATEQDVAALYAAQFPEKKKGASQ
jgi:anti-sigma factor RsiW